MNHIPIIMPCRDVRAVVTTILVLNDAVFRIGKKPVWIVRSGEGIALHRTNMLKETVQLLDKHGYDVSRGFRGIFCDDDIYIGQDSLLPLIEAMQYADNHNINIVVPIPLINGRYSVSKNLAPNGSLTRQEVEALENYSRVPIGGLGFYYGWIPSNYEFHEGGREKNYGEDWNFFLDNKIPLNVAKIPMRHFKYLLWDNEVSHVATY